MPLFRHRRLNVHPRAPRPARVLVAALGLAPLFGVLASGGSGASAASAATACIRSGSDAAIQAALTGPGAVASLCPHSVFRLSNTVTFTAPHQVIQTEGRPAGPARAKLEIVSRNLTIALAGTNESYVTIRNIQVSGERQRLGFVPPPPVGGALIEMGGNATGQTIEHVYAHDPRSWSTLHMFEGGSKFPPGCEHARILDNTIGPAGFPKGRWADGISMACGHTLVEGNKVIDATDGGIVVYGADGSMVRDNTIIAATRTLLGGINMVDSGFDYQGTTVTHNIIDAKGALIKVGIGEGNVWFCDIYNTYHVESGATVTANILEGQHMGYGFAVSGVRDWRVTGNIDKSTHVGYLAVKVCNYSVRNSLPAGFQVQSATDTTLQHNFARHQHLRYLLGLSVRPPTISLRAHATGLFVSADAARTKPLIANRSSLGRGEQYRVKYLRHGYIQLRAVANDRWVTAPHGGRGLLIASSATAGRAQTFKLIRHRDGSVSLLSLADNKYVTVLHNGNLIARTGAVHRAQEFDLLGWCLKTAACTE
jgi:parallel beta-helix repeat protein